MNFLEQVCGATTRRVQRNKQLMPSASLERICENIDDSPSLKAAITRQPGEGIKAIAEVKRCSPSKGAIRPSLVVEELVRNYQAAGAAAISVLTEPFFFGGSLTDLAKAGNSVDLPVLRKDFIFDSYQLLEAKGWGASAVLLIVSILEQAQLEGLLHEASRLGLEALVEVHDEQEVARAVEAGADILGINNRNLTTLEVDLDTTIRLLPLVPREKVTVSESGYSRPDQVARAMHAGADAILVGEALAGDDNPVAALSRLRGFRK